MHPIGIGCMRISTERDRDEARALAVLSAALDLGVTIFDTADAYCLDDSDVGHNERLIAHALTNWRGDRSRITVATKGGLTRPNGQWVADGRARHLRAACEASLKALGVDRLDVYQLHAPDPRVPLSTSVRAVASLKEEGLVARIGLCNVNVGQIEEARRIAEISSVQIEVSVWHDENLLNGVVEYCSMHGIQLLAYRPLGGARRVGQLRHRPAVAELAERHNATPAEIALAWLYGLSGHIVPLPGPTRVETVRSVVRARAIQLDDNDRDRMGGQFRRRELTPTAAPRDGEVVLIMGLAGAGKSTYARRFVDEGYVRLNRDEAGGSLRELLPDLQRAVDEGRTRIVLDNTYLSRASRARVVQAAHALGLQVRCVWLATSIEDAQVNAVSRILSNHGHLLEPAEMKQARKKDISAFAPGVQFRQQRELEPPDQSEAFSSIDVVPFERTHDPSMTNKALIVWCDASLEARGAGGGAVLRRYRDAGFLLLGLAWRPEIAENTTTAEQVEAEFARTQRQLGVSIDMLYCPHQAGPPTCWCRKPLPGLGVMLIQRHRLDPSQCIYIASGPQDPGFARRLGFQYRHAGEFFASEAS
jgi:aryl-alcohol dehydrogenase-like predicted oxidoreductase/predicted kinase